MLLLLLLLLLLQLPQQLLMERIRGDGSAIEQVADRTVKRLRCRRRPSVCVVKRSVPCVGSTPCRSRRARPWTADELTSLRVAVPRAAAVSVAGHGADERAPRGNCRRPGVDGCRAAAAAVATVAAPAGAAQSHPEALAGDAVQEEVDGVVDVKDLQRTQNNLPLTARKTRLLTALRGKDRRT